jgi:manganese/zinc/iron transport system substrate-binding protein
MNLLNRIIGIVLIALFIVAAALIIVFVVINKGEKPDTITETKKQQTPEKIDVHINPYKSEPLNIVVTTDFIRELVYMFARYRSNPTPIIIKPATNPLLYKATEKDEKLMMEADLVIYHGLGLEPQCLTEMIERVSKKVPCKAITRCLSKEDLIPSSVYKGGYDPHVWWDLQLWEKILRYMVDILASVDPDYEFDYGSTFIRYGQELSFVRRYFKSWSERIPKEKRMLITPHAAFAYFGRAFDFEVKSLYKPGTNTMSKQRLKELADFMIAKQVTVVFAEKAFPVDDINLLIKELERRGHGVSIGEELFSYSLGEINTNEYIFLKASRIFIERIYRALKPPDALELPL